MAGSDDLNRRQLKTRSRAWPAMIAGWLASAGIRPNQISVLSIAFAVGAAACFCLSARQPGWASARWLIGAAIGIQLRLLCNLLDGLLAIEGGMKTPTGDLYNEIPDRLADIVILVGAGWAVSTIAFGPELGWSAALLAVLTAYIRLLGGSLRLVQDFGGPMAKQHRMFALTVGTLAATAEVITRGSVVSLYAALVIIAIGSAVTLFRRTAGIARALSSR